MKLYMLVMSGQGDTYITLVDKVTWDWVMSPKKTIPPAVLVAYREKRNEDREGNDFPCITSGSPVNDAALAVAGYTIGDRRAEFYKMSLAIQFISKNNIEIVDEWNGYIY